MSQHQNQIEPAHPEISWQAPEFKYYHKNMGWYVTFIAISVLIIGFFAIQKDYFGAISLALLALLVAFFSRQQPGIIDITIDRSGIQYGHIRYPYDQIKRFWIVHTEHHQTVNLETTALVNNYLILELGDIDPDTVRELLASRIPEHEAPHPTLAQRISHKFRF